MSAPHRVSRLAHQALATTVDGARISWHRYIPKRVTHDAAPLLLIHGFACGSKDWGSLPQALATISRREVLSFDNRGIGESSVPDGPYSVDLMASDALTVLDSANVPRAHVLGISLGGMIAQSLALEHPRRVRGLVLGATSHGGRQAHPVPDEFVTLCTRWAAEDLPNESPCVDEFLRWMLPASAMAQPSGARLLDQFKSSFLHTSRGSTGLLGQLAALGRFNSTKRLEALARHRTLAICGSLDAVIPPANSESLQQRIPGAKLTQWENAGHFFWAHRPSEVAGLLARFLSECDLHDDVDSDLDFFIDSALHRGK